MERFIHEDNTPESKREIVRDWLNGWLSAIEVQTILDAKMTTSHGTETLVIKFKR